MSKRSGLVNKSALAPCFFEILVDMHMADAIQSTPSFRDLSLDYDSIDLYSDIFLQHETNKLAFDSTLIYYSKNPRDLVSIYDEVIMKMTMINDSLQPAIEE